MKPQDLQYQLQPLIDRYRTELEEELYDMKMQGITQGWEECRQAHKIQLPKVLEELIVSCRGIVNTTTAEKFLAEYKKNNNIQMMFNEREIHRALQEAFESGKRHVKSIVDGQQPYYDHSLDFADRYIENIKHVRTERKSYDDEPAVVVGPQMPPREEVGRDATLDRDDRLLERAIAGMERGSGLIRPENQTPIDVIAPRILTNKLAMLKLYIQERVNFSPAIEVPESVFQIDGYAIADRLLEGVMFNITFRDREILSVEVDPKYADYFEDFNTAKWLKEVRDYAQEILDRGGDEVFISPAIARKYNANVAFIVDESELRKDLTL